MARLKLSSSAETEHDAFEEILNVRACDFFFFLCIQFEKTPRWVRVGVGLGVGGVCKNIVKFPGASERLIFTLYKTAFTADQPVRCSPVTPAQILCSPTSLQVFHLCVCAYACACVCVCAQATAEHCCNLPFTPVKIRYLHLPLHQQSLHRSHCLQRSCKRANTHTLTKHATLICSSVTNGGDGGGGSPP